jgi:hypothetical protein
VLSPREAYQRDQKKARQALAQERIPFTYEEILFPRNRSHREFLLRNQGAVDHHNNPQGPPPAPVPHVPVSHPAPPWNPQPVRQLPPVPSRTFQLFSESLRSPAPLAAAARPESALSTRSVDLADRRIRRICQSLVGAQPVTTERFKMIVRRLKIDPKTAAAIQKECGESAQALVTLLLNGGEGVLALVPQRVRGTLMSFSEAKMAWSKVPRSSVNK